MRLRQPGFTCGACGPFPCGHRERIQKFKEISDLNCISKKELDAASFVHDDAYADSKNLARQIVSGNVLKEIAYEIALNPKFDGYQRRLASAAD